MKQNDMFDVLSGVLKLSEFHRIGHYVGGLPSTNCLWR